MKIIPHSYGTHNLLDMTSKKVNIYTKHDKSHGKDTHRIQCEHGERFAPSMGAKEDIGRDKGCSLKAGWKTSVLLSNIFYIDF